MNRNILLKRTSFGTMVVMAIVLAVTTGIEKFKGSPFVHEHIYGSWWFVLIWAVLGISGLLYLFAPKSGKGGAPVIRGKAASLLHVAFFIILCGAFITYLTGEKGYIHIRQGDTASTYVNEDDMTEQALPFAVKLILFDIEYHPDTDEPADYISFLKVDDEICRVSMNKIHKKQGYRIYQLGYDEDEMGATFLVSHDPYGIAVTYSGYLLLALSMAWLLFLRIGGKGVLSIAILTAVVWYYISRINPMTPILRSPMLAAHVSVIMVAYVLLLLIAVFSIAGLASSKRSRKFYRWNSLLLYPALFLLAAGIFIGAVWANISWGRYWGWDAKETWALITLIVYAFPFHKKSIPWFRDAKHSHRYNLLAFLSILMTFFGVSFILGGIHAYL